MSGWAKRKTPCAATSTGCASSEQSDDSPSQPDGEEYVDKLTGNPFNPKAKSSTVMVSGDLPVDLQWGTRASPNVNIDEAPRDEAPEPAATQKRWYVTEALVKGHGRTMGCPRCLTGIRTHNAVCRGRIEGILLQQSRMKPK